MRLTMIVSVVVLSWSNLAFAQETAYSKMAPVEQYLMRDRSAEIALARTAAPDAIARDAEVLVLERHGYVSASKGKNGFVCWVGRGFTSAADADFWNPKVRVPMCINAPGKRSYLVRVKKETSWVLAGLTKVQLEKTITAAIAKKELPAMEPGTMCYMMGREGFGGDVQPHWPPHLMFFLSKTDPVAWGANLPNSPVIANADPLEQMTSFVILASIWSDGTEYVRSTPHSHQ